MSLVHRNPHKSAAISNTLLVLAAAWSLFLGTASFANEDFDTFDFVGVTTIQSVTYDVYEADFSSTQLATVGCIDLYVQRSGLVIMEAEIRLLSPEGTEVSILDSGAVSLIDVTFSDTGVPYSATTNLDCGCLMQAAGDLSDFAGEDAPGVWTILYRDSGGLTPPPVMELTIRDGPTSPAVANLQCDVVAGDDVLVTWSNPVPYVDLRIGTGPSQFVVDPTSNFFVLQDLVPGIHVIQVVSRQNCNCWSATTCQVEVQVPFLRGDANGDLQVHVADPLFFLNFLFGLGVVDCPRAADSNDDGVLDLADAIYTFMYLFLGGPPPPAPFPQVGTDSTPDGLGCAQP